MIEVNKGVLVIGLANTVLFGGDETIELLMLNVATGQDFSIPLTGEQATYLLEQVTMEELLNIDEEPTEEGDGAQADRSVHEAYAELSRTRPDLVTNARAALDDVLARPSNEVAVDAFTASEKTPQL
jgi:hypothetical protein